jgi:hypothetical protein
MSKSILSFLTIVVGAALLLAGCGDDQQEAETISVLQRQYSVEPFEAYRDRALRIIDGKRLYQVEWDLFYSSEKDLYDHYRSRVEQDVDKSTAIVDQSTGQHVLFLGTTAVNIRYCVSTNFGSQHDQVVADIAVATKGWQDTANVRFKYVSSRDSNCAQADSQIDVAVIQGGSASACATPPSLPPATLPVWCPNPLGSLAIDYASWRWSWLSSYPNLQAIGVLRHELGHILGLRHEHVRGPSCESPVVCNGSACLGSDYLTDYDVNSVMHYPQCQGVATTSWPISPLDGIGIRKLYGMPAAWYVAPVLSG